MWKPEHRCVASVTAFVTKATSPTPNGHWVADDPTGQARWPAAGCECPRGVQRDLLCAVDRCHWQASPKDLPPKVHFYFMLWDWDGTLGAHSQRALRGDARQGSGRHYRRTKQMISPLARCLSLPLGVLASPSNQDRDETRERVHRPNQGARPRRSSTARAIFSLTAGNEMAIHKKLLVSVGDTIADVVMKSM